jgi:rhodanese-related sulfurtransferase
VHEGQKDLQILDVREDDEWAAGRVEGAVHIPLGQLATRQGELDSDLPVVTVCRTGGRASKAAEQLAASGMSVQVMEGGMEGWEREGLPISTPEGRPGRVG